MPRSSLFSLLLLLYSISCFAFSSCADEKDLKAYAYIDEYKLLAVEEMHLNGVPASIKLAQGMLESNFGHSRLATEGKNHFGIKCKSYWKGETIRENDDAPNECFRKYQSVEASYKDHSYFLQHHAGGRYSHLFKYDRTDYTSWAFGLKKAGYATADHYPYTLVKYIEKYELHQYDLMSIEEVEALTPLVSQHTSATTTQKHDSAVGHSPQINNQDVAQLKSGFLSAYEDNTHYYFPWLNQAERKFLDKSTNQVVSLPQAKPSSRPSIPTTERVAVKRNSPINGVINSNEQNVADINEKDKPGLTSYYTKSA